VVVVSGLQKVRDKTVVHPKEVSMPMLENAPPSVQVNPKMAAPTPPTPIPAPKAGH
jgi:hypothetical protein